MDGFSEIFQAMIQDHGQRPRNFGILEEATHSAEGVNPVTGDRIEIFIRTTSDDETERIEEITFTGKASALGITSASVMTKHLVSMTVSEARETIEQTLQWIDAKGEIPDDLPEEPHPSTIPMTSAR